MLVNKIAGDDVLPSRMLGTGRESLPPLVIPADAGIHGGFSPGVKCGYVYILASRRNGTLYVGITTNLVRRVSEHKEDFIDGFTKKYGVHLLVYFEQYESIVAAIRREKQIKRWKRAWKIQLIEKYNPNWKDLYCDLVGA